MRLVGTLALISCAMVHAQAGLDKSLLSHCGMRLRVATHHAPPFVIVDKTKCTEQMCPPAAFEPDGGLTYRLMTVDVLPKLKQMCTDNGKSGNVEIDWFLPLDLTTSGESAVNMVCNQGWGEGAHLTKVNAANPACKSSMPGGYKGASPASSACRGAYGASAAVCNSTGPDAAVGAIHISRERLDMVSFTTPYYFVNQVVVKRPDSLFELSLASVMTVFAPFSLDMWLAILAEIFVVFLCIIAVEVGVEHFRTLLMPKPDDTVIGQPKNEHLCEGWSAVPDAWFFSCGSAFDPGGPGKAPVTIGGKLFMLGHWLFVVIIAASYTGTIGPYLSDSSSTPFVTGVDSLYGGAFSVAVRGPTFDSSLEAPEFLGVHKGGNSDKGVEPSSQFKYLQAVMRADKAARFQIVSTKRMDSRFKDDTTPLVYDKATDPCRVSGARLGAYDLVMCGRDDGADSLIADAPSAFYELNRRYNETKDCKLLSVGAQFSPSGFGVAFPKTSPFVAPMSYAVHEVASRARVAQLKEEYGIRESDAKCISSSDTSGALIMTIQLVAGLFIIVCVFGCLAAVHGIVERVLYFIKKRLEERVEELEEEEEGDEDGKDQELAAKGATLSERMELLYAGSGRIERQIQKLADRKQAAEAGAEGASKPAKQGKEGDASVAGVDLVFSSLFKPFSENPS